MATPAELREQAQQFQTQITHFGLPLSGLSTKISSLSSTSTAESSEKIKAALSATEALLNFLRATPVATTPRVHGELLSLISQLFGLFAVAEGTASALAAECDPFIHDIQEFEEGNVEPMSMVLEQLKERAQRSSDRLSTRVQELKSQRLSVQNEAESKMTGIRRLEKQLEEQGDNVNGLYAQIEALEAEKNVLERKALRVKERQRTQGQAAVAGNFFSAFAPVFVPLAMTGGAVAVVTQDQILTLSEKIRHLRHQITGAAPTALEDAIAELRDEHKRLDGVGKAMSSALFELEADHEFTENTCLLLTALDDQLEAMRREMVKARETAETLKARLTSEAKKAEGCKHELAQALVTTSRMGYDEAKAYVLAPVRTALKLLEDVPESDAPREILTALTADSWRE